MIATIFDVIDNFWGNDPLRKIARADKVTFSRFAKQVNTFYESYEITPVTEGEFRSYYGGLVATNFSLTGKQRTFFNNLLYTHSTIVPDPIARWYFDRYEDPTKTPVVDYFGGQAFADQSEWIGWLLNSHRAFCWDLEMSREILTYFVERLLTLRPLVEAGIVVLVSQAQMLIEGSSEIVSQALNDAADCGFVSICATSGDEQPPLWDNIRGGIMTPSLNSVAPAPDLAAWAQAKEAAYHIRKNLAIAAYAGGYYVPENNTDSRLLKQILLMSGQRAGYRDWETDIALSLEGLTLPSLEGLSLVDLIQIRKEESAFNEFRAWLAQRLLPASGNRTHPSVELTSQEIEIEVNRLRNQLSKSAVIKKFLSENGLRISAQALVGLVMGSAGGQAIAGAAAGTFTGIVSALINRGTQRGVLAQLATMNRTAPDATFGGSSPSNLPKPLRMPFFGEFRVGPKRPEEPFTTAKLRKIVAEALQPNPTNNPFRAIAPK